MFCFFFFNELPISNVRFFGVPRVKNSVHPYIFISGLYFGYIRIEVFQKNSTTQNYFRNIWIWEKLCASMKSVSRTKNCILPRNHREKNGLKL